MTSEEFKERSENLLNGLPAEVERLLVGAAGNAKDIIETRVTQKGLNAKGQSFESIKDYTPAYKLRKAGLKKSDVKKANKTLDRRLNSGRPVSPDTLDRAIGVTGRYRGMVDLTYTGRMWANIKPLLVLTTNNQVLVSVGAESEENKKKLEGNTSGNGKWPGRGEILSLSANEAELLERTFEEDVARYVNKMFFEQ